MLSSFASRVPFWLFSANFSCVSFEFNSDISIPEDQIMMPYFSLKSLEFMNEILRYNATIQINPFGRIFVRYYSFSKDFTPKKFESVRKLLLCWRATVSWVKGLK